MKVKSKLDGTFSGVGELLKPFDRVLPNLGAAIATVLNGTDLDQKLILMGGTTVGTPGKIASATTLSLYSFSGNVDQLETDRVVPNTNISKFTGTVDGSSWSWSELNGTTSNADPFNSEASTLATAINRIINPRAVDSPSITSADVAGIFIDQGNNYFHATDYDWAQSFSTITGIGDLALIANLSVVGKQFGE